RSWRGARLSGAPAGSPAGQAPTYLCHLASAQSSQAQSALTGIYKGLSQLVVALHRGKLREFGHHVGRGAEEDAGVGLLQHAGVVVGVAGRNAAKVEPVEGLDGAALGVGLAQAVVRHPALLIQ